MPREITIPHDWTPRIYQEPLWNYFEGSEEGKRAVAIWHRRAGKDVLGINLCATKIFERVGVYWHLLPTYKQGRAIVWNGFTREGRRFLDFFPPEIVESRQQQEMRVHFRNGSIYQVVGTDDVNTLVGTNPVGCIFSEYSLHNPAAWEYIRPILTENGGWALFIYTPRAKNHGWRLLQDAKRAKWFYDIRFAGSQPGATVRHDGTPVITDEQIEDERKAGMPEEMVQQEFYVSFESAMMGAYYSQQLAKMFKEGRVANIPYDPKLPVDTHWDIGYDDSTVILFVQTYGFENRIIDCYENSGEGIAHYAKVLKERPYAYGNHYGPWDIAIHEWSAGRARIDVAREHGVRFKVTDKHELEDGIEQCRNIFPSVWIDGTKCERLIDALGQYRKEWDAERRVYKTKPVHDWSSHYADAFRVMCWNAKRRPRTRKQPQDFAVDEYNYI